ncbi:hypothetical protein SAMN05216216_11330 [Lacicoccus qingdaonensis]|uniref:Uncharacterized protein n=1 Tax=Lacicoccus qingdaonensis TaxID=576118 RepID=A0A1G9FNL2_9BACL|nr:hypothetical protein SAMN05216216_11330 [Salinicoccus qingdaonensis]
MAHYREVMCLKRILHRSSSSNSSNFALINPSYFLLHDFKAIKYNTAVINANPAVTGQNQAETIPSGLARPISEKSIKVNIIPLNRTTVTGTAYFHGTISTYISPFESRNEHLKIFHLKCTGEVYTSLFEATE